MQKEIINKLKLNCISLVRFCLVSCLAFKNKIILKKHVTYPKPYVVLNGVIVSNTNIS